MIKINLLGNGTAADRTKVMQVLAFAASIVLTLGVFYYLNSSVTSGIADLTAQSQSLQADLSRIEKTTREVRDLEAKKAEYNSKLVVIATLKKSKAGPVRVLDDLNNALPDKSWLTEVREQNGVFRMSGRALDDQTIAAFMRDLEKSDYFDEAREVVVRRSDRDGVKIRDFTFQTAVSYTGKIEVAPAPAEPPAAGKNKNKPGK